MPRLYHERHTLPLYEDRTQKVRKKLQKSAFVYTARGRRRGMKREEEIKNEADVYAEKHGFRVPYDGSNNFYDEVDVKASIEGFIAGAKWADKTLLDKACEWLEEFTIDYVNDTKLGFYKKNFSQISKKQCFIKHSSFERIGKN